MSEFAYETQPRHAYLPAVIMPRVQRVQDRVAEYALDGFTVLGAVERPSDQMRRELQKVIVDQESAIDAIAEAVDRSEARIPGGQAAGGDAGIPWSHWCR